MSTKIEAWTTENSDAVIWGTHDLEAAKKAYAALGMDTEPDWDDIRLMWGDATLADEEVWDSTKYGHIRAPGWVPYAVYGF